MRLLLLMIVTALIGCEGNEAYLQREISARENAGKRTLESFKNPTLVGTLGDGRPVYHITREVVNSDGYLSAYPHHIYFVGTTTTMNTVLPSGKFTRPAVTVTIDGVEYVKKDENKPTDPPATK